MDRQSLTPSIALDMKLVQTDGFLLACPLLFLQAKRAKAIALRYQLPSYLGLDLLDLIFRNSLEKWEEYQFFDELFKTYKKWSSENWKTINIPPSLIDDLLRKIDRMVIRTSIDYFRSREWTFNSFSKVKRLARKRQLVSPYLKR